MIIIFLNNICCVIITVLRKLQSNFTLLIFVKNFLLDNLTVCAINLICCGVLNAVGVVCVVLVWCAWMVAVWWRGWISESGTTRVLLAHLPLLLNCGHLCLQGWGNTHNFLLLMLHAKFFFFFFSC